MSKKKNDPYVSRSFCDERFKRVETMYANIDSKLEDIKQNSNMWKAWALGIVSSIITGIIILVLS